MLLALYLLFLVWGLALIRKICKECIKEGDPIEGGSMFVALLVAIVPIANVFGCILVSWFIIEQWVEKLDKDKVTDFWRRIFLIGKK